MVTLSGTRINVIITIPTNQGVPGVPIPESKAYNSRFPDPELTKGFLM